MKLVDRYISKPLAAITKSKGLWQSAYSVGGNIFATAISAIALILITRILGPEDFGVFSVGFSLALILVKFNDFGLNTATIKYCSKQLTPEVNNTFYSLIIRYKLAITGLIVIGSTLILSSFLVIPHTFNVSILLLASILSFGTVFYEQLLVLFQTQHLFIPAVATNLLQAIIKISGVGLLVFFAIENVYLVLAMYLLAPFLSSLVMVRYLPKWIKLNVSASNPEFQRKISAIVKHSSVAILSAGMIENLDILFINYFLTDYDTGLYSGVVRISQLFALAAYYLGDVLNARVALYTDKDNIDSYIPKALGILFLSLLGFLITIPLSKYFIIYTIGEQYLSAQVPLIILLGSSFLKIASMPFLAMYYALADYWAFSLTGILQIAVLIIGSLLFIPTFGLLGASYVKLGTQAVLLVLSILINLYAYKRKYSVK